VIPTELRNDFPIFHFSVSDALNKFFEAKALVDYNKEGSVFPIFIPSWIPTGNPSERIKQLCFTRLDLERINALIFIILEPCQVETYKAYLQSLEGPFTNCFILKLASKYHYS
jgi:hypothetical protein